MIGTGKKLGKLIQRQKVEIAQLKEELRDNQANRDAMDEESFNLEQCMTANANLINDNKGLEA